MISNASFWICIGVERGELLFAFRERGQGFVAAARGNERREAFHRRESRRHGVEE